MVTQRTINHFTVKPAIYGGYGIFAIGTSQVDDGTPIPMAELFAVGSDPAEAGAAVTDMLTKLAEAIASSEDPPPES